MKPKEMCVEICQLESLQRENDLLSGAINAFVRAIAGAGSPDDCHLRLIAVGLTHAKAIEIAKRKS